ncbi:TIGR04348 family glycosyltransferase [Marinobacter sediminum]|uniref:selenoneine biosynthesis selenosugar synthase SenB n=1 Tax=Marinobacter sediminum TaxID=256323 RepID=UPI00202F74CD|nr:selenoneine biosynthesis selenosugar synthase SenB [Marinobacter sediminum]MCM0612024.1 TIGR04348 family glycosyltransferase [Marinobacter sediminum]
MKIIMITPAAPGSKAGNRATAERWKALLEEGGHQASVVTEYHGAPCDVFVALHAWRSHEAIETFRRCWPEAPLIVVLTGTDIYRHQHEYPTDTLASMEAADVLIGLHALVAQDIPPHYADKLVTLFQSADVAQGLPARGGDRATFDVCVIGHLREEKDSLRAALAARLLPEGSRVRVLCAGKPHDSQWQAAAEREMRENPRFQWLGELDKPDIAKLMAESRVMVISSIMEGGANVVSEACRAGVPVLASDIPGNRGLLGKDYGGYYPVGDERMLAAMLLRAETDPTFLERLEHQVGELAPKFTPDNERHTLEQALELAVQRRSPRGQG